MLLFLLFFSLAVHSVTLSFVIFIALLCFIFEIVSLAFYFCIRLHTWMRSNMHNHVDFFTNEQNQTEKKHLASGSKTQTHTHTHIDYSPLNCISLGWCALYGQKHLLNDWLRSNYTNESAYYKCWCLRKFPSRKKMRKESGDLQSNTNNGKQLCRCFIINDFKLTLMLIKFAWCFTTRWMTIHTTFSQLCAFTFTLVVVVIVGGGTVTKGNKERVLRRYCAEVER